MGATFPMPEEPHHAPAMPFDVPTVEEMSALLPQYVFERLAAFGGMGAVYKARQASLDRPVAVKILPPAFGAEPEFAERFKSEARAMARLNHTNIVAVYDFGITAEGHLYLVMEWVEGHTIHELIQKGIIPVRKVANLATQLCDALHFAHSHKILHRDIKPGNIMVNQEDQVKVADFGLARPITGEAEENPYGTPDYAAPEIMNKGAVDQRVDIFAAGIVLYEMLTGRVPRQQRRSVTEFAPVSARWDEVIAKATDANPALRYQDVRDFRTNIMMAMSQVASAPVPTAKLVEDSEQTPRSFSSVQWAIFAACIAVAAGVGFLMMPSSDVKQPEDTKVVQAPVVVEKKVQAEAPKKVKPAEIEVVTVKPDEKEVKQAPPVKKTAKPEKTVEIAVASVPVVKAPEPPPMVKEPPKVDLSTLEERDAELTQLLASFSAEWETNAELNTTPARKELAAKYIPALQRGLTGLPVDQRDHVLSEISQVANNTPLSEPAESWPGVLKQLRKTYDEQIGAINSKSEAAAVATRAAQSAAVVALAQKRTAAGDMEGAKRAELVSAALMKVKGPPSVDAIKEVGGKL